jgi:hypothetical protein
MNSIITNKPAKDKVHVYLEELFKEKFGVFLEIHHTQFNPPVRLPHSRKTIRARTAVMAYKDRAEVDIANSAPGTVKPLAITESCCAANDVFVKREGLRLALHRLYRELSAKKKNGEI